MSLGNSTKDVSWVANPAWTIVSFDPVNELAQKITIAGALFAETQGKGQQYLIVDIDRPSGDAAEPHITRYRIDPARASGTYWVKHDTTVDIDAAGYRSIVGRISGKPVDGIYTAGTTGGQPQLVYEPVINYYGDGPAPPRRLQLPGGAIPSAIATARGTDGSTDLYAVGGSTLYRFPADEQEGDFEPNAVIQSEYLSGTDTLRVMSHNGVATVWSRTASDLVYYTTCADDRLWDPSAWSSPMPVLAGVERMSAYVNRADGGNTIFASGNGRLQRLVQGSKATGGVWRAHNITLALPPEEKATSFMSYTTSIYVTQASGNVPIPSAVLHLSANMRTPVYINGLYYILSTTPIQVAADATGSLTVVEATESLHGAVLTVSLGDASSTIDTMSQSFDKLSGLDTGDKVRSAQVPKQTVAGGIVGDPGYTPLASPSADQNDVNAVALNMKVLQSAYAQMQGRGSHGSTTAAAAHAARVQGVSMASSLSPHMIRPLQLSFWDGLKHLGDNLGDLLEDGVDELGTLAGDVGKVLESFGHTIGALAGDVWNWAKQAAETVGRLVINTVDGTLHFFAKIGDKIYHAVLDTVHAIVSAAEWVWNKVKAGIKMLWDFLQMLFDWDDIRRTKNVIHNMTKLWLQAQVDNIPRARDALDGAIKGVEGRINEWANISDWDPGLGQAAQKTASSAAGDPSTSLTSSSKFLADKYKDHARQL